MQAIATTLKRLTNLFRHLPATRRQAPRSACLRLEALEDRLVPTVTPAALLTTSPTLVKGGTSLVGLVNPLPPSGFAVAQYSNSTVSLSWNAASGASGYLVDEAVGDTWRQIASLNSSTHSFAVGGLATSNWYYFRVGANDSQGTGWTNSQSVVMADHPYANGETYTAATGSLFGPNGPSYRDVQQGYDDDCWLMASLAEVAAREPAKITSMFTYVGTNDYQGTTVSVYTVRLYNSSGQARYMTVDTELPVGTLTDHPANGTYWVALVEKAYAEANGMGFVTTNDVGSDSYSALGADNGGKVNWALQAILGHTGSDYSINPSNAASAWKAGELVLLCTTTPTDSYSIVANHVYAMVGYNGGSLPFEVFNPWGTTSAGYAPRPYNGHQIWGDFVCNTTYLSQNFHDQMVSAGAGGIQWDPMGSFVTELPVSLHGPALARIGFTQADSTNTSNSAAIVPVTKPVEATAQLAVQTPASTGAAGELFWVQLGKHNAGPDFLGQSWLAF